MRILVSGLSADKNGGIESFLINMNKFMSDDCVFDYVIEDETHKTIHQADIERKGGKIFYVSPKRNIKQNISDWKALLGLNKKIYDIVYFNLYSMSWIKPAEIALRMNYKVILHAHNNKLHKCSFPIKALHYINKKRQKKFDFVRFTNSKLSAEFMFGDPDSADMIYNAIDTERFQYNDEDRTYFRSKYHVADKNVYGFSGRLMFQKNPIFLIAVFDEIQKSDSNAVLMVAGDGDLLSEVKKEIQVRKLEEKVILLGNVREIEKFYSAVDVFVLPSRFEGLGIVLIEAQSSGLPCLTSKNVVPIEAKVTELLHYIELQENPEDWAKIAADLMKHKSIADRKRYSDEVKNSNYNIMNEAKRLESIFQAVAKEKRI